MRAKCLTILLAIFFFGCSSGGEKQPEKGTALKGKSVLMIIAQSNFKDVEYEKPRKAFENQGAKVTIASTTTDEATGADGAKVTPDSAMKNADAKKYDAVVFVGGPGVTAFFSDADAHKIAKDAADAGKVVAAICLAPGVLAKAGVLKDKKATIYHESADDEYVKMLKDGGATFEDKAVVTDGKIVTANGPTAAADFAEAIIKLLK